MTTKNADVAEWSRELHAQASAQTGLTDFGPETYRLGLDVLLQSIADEMPDARPTASAIIVSQLVSRLITQKGFAAHAACLARPIKQPLIIIGIPRSGTTALHKLLSIDPQFQGLQSWLCSTPMPRPPRESWEQVPEFVKARAEREAVYLAKPDLQIAHAVEAAEVDECLVPMSQEFSSNLFASLFGTNAYTAWHAEQNEAAAYARFADVLRLVGSNDPDRRWLLKNPGHLRGIDTVLEIFPDACIVQTHRAPVSMMASLTSVLATMRLQVTGRDDGQKIVRRELAYWSEASRRGMAAQERLPQQFHNVDYRRLMSDPIATLRGVYDKFGLTLSPEIGAEMQVWLNDNPQNKHGVHNYSLERFGVSEAEVQHIFADYIACYDL